MGEKKADPVDWNKLGSTKKPKPVDKKKKATPAKPVAAETPNKTKPPEPEKQDDIKLGPLSRFYTNRTIFKGMSWLIYGDSDDGKTYLLESAADVGELWVVDTETRAQDTHLLEFPDTKFPIHVIEPVVMKPLVGEEDEDPIDLEATFNNIYQFVLEFAYAVDKGEIPSGSFVGIESMSDIWDWIQSFSKARQAKAQKKLVENLGDDVEWTTIKDRHMKMVLILNGLRTKGINVIYTARRGDIDENAKTREIRSEKNLPYHVQNHVKVKSEMIGKEKVKFCIIERILTKSNYERMDWPTFSMLIDYANKKLTENNRAKKPAGKK